MTISPEEAGRAVEAAQRILDYWDIPNGRLPRAPHSKDEVEVARFVLSIAVPSSLVDDEDERGFTPSDYATTAEGLRGSEKMRKATASNQHNIILAALDRCALSLLSRAPKEDDRDARIAGLEALLCDAQAEVAALKHDIERHLAIASKLATEGERLRASLARMVADFGDVCDEGDMEAKAVIAEARAALSPQQESEG